MPYQPLSFVDGNKDHPVLVFVRKELDPLLCEFRNLLLIPHYIDIPIGSWQKSQIILLLSIIDGCAQLFIPGNMKIGERFTSFIKDNFPWTIDKPLNITPEEACELLWNYARCPVMHRLGIRYKPKATSTICYMRIHSTTDENITRLETNTNVKPYNEPTIKKDKNKEKIFIFIESLYWCTRYAIQKSLDSKQKLDAVEKWLTSGEWDKKRDQKKPLATPPLKISLLLPPGQPSPLRHQAQLLLDLDHAQAMVPQPRARHAMATSVIARSFPPKAGIDEAIQSPKRHLQKTLDRHVA